MIDLKKQGVSPAFLLLLGILLGPRQRILDNGYRMSSDFCRITADPLYHLFGHPCASVHHSQQDAEQTGSAGQSRYLIDRRQTPVERLHVEVVGHHRYHVGMRGTQAIE